MTYKNTVSQFINDRSGNMILVAAIVVPVLLMGIGAAVSYSNGVNKRTKLQTHADIMSLAMAKITNQTSMAAAEDYYDEYVLTHLDEEANCSFTLEDNPSEATVNCSGEVNSFLSGMLEKKTVPYSVVSKAQISTDSIYEVAFVFDVSDSMSGAEIDDLKAGLATISKSALFNDKESRLSLLPFANTVRLGQRFDKFVTPGTGYAAAGGAYNGCFDRDATDPNVDLSSNLAPTFSLVTNLINSRVVCPKPSMTAIFHAKAKDWLIQDMAVNLETSFGTGMSDGLVWAFRSLDPDMRGIMSNASRYPLDSHSGSSKHIIMMTDGRPYDRPWTGPGGGDVTQALSLDRFEDVCAALPFAAKGINFHLINYNNKNISQEYVDVFQNCVAGEGQFHDVDAGGLEAILNKITEHVSGLRLTQ